MNTIKFQTVANYIKRQAVKGSFSLDTAHKLEDGQLILRDNTEFIRKEVTAGGTVKLIDPNTTIKTGVSSFVGNKLDKTINHVITHLRLGYATDEYSGKEAELVYSNEENAVPAALRNANIVITQDGKPVIKLPVMDFIKPANDGNSSFTELSSFALIKEEQPFTIMLEFPDGATMGAGVHYVEVALKGMATFEK
jgi:hypothetical protein